MHPIPFLALVWTVIGWAMWHPSFTAGIRAWRKRRAYLKRIGRRTR